jgi:hypothetical protein
MSQKYTTLTVIALALIGTVITVAVAAALSASVSIPLNGTISTVNVEAYSDSACTVPVTSLSMGSISPGESVTRTIYIKNSGSIPVTLTMTTSGWNPTSASSYLTLSWTRQNHVLIAGASVSAELTLTADSDTGSLTVFSCSVTITGTE